MNLEKDVISPIEIDDGLEHFPDFVPKEALLQKLAEILRERDGLIDYAELARRMRLKERLVRDLKNAGVIRPALDLGKTVRFHWPSVLAQLTKAGPHRNR